MIWWWMGPYWHSRTSTSTIRFFSGILVSVIYTRSWDASDIRVSWGLWVSMELLPLFFPLGYLGWIFGVAPKNQTALSLLFLFLNFLEGTQEGEFEWKMVAEVSVEAQHFSPRLFNSKNVFFRNDNTAFWGSCMVTIINNLLRYRS